MSEQWLLTDNGTLHGEETWMQPTSSPTDPVDITKAEAQQHCHDEGCPHYGTAGICTPKPRGCSFTPSVVCGNCDTALPAGCAGEFLDDGAACRLNTPVPQAAQALAEAAVKELTAPIDMILHCPACGMQHIDAPENIDLSGPWPGGRWTNPPHRSHLCHGCGHIWRPADVPTNGVQHIKTRGKNDSPDLEEEQHTEAACYALEALWQICPEVAIREDNRSVLNPNQLETLMRRFGWKPPSEWGKTEPTADQMLAWLNEQAWKGCVTAGFETDGGVYVTLDPAGGPLVVAREAVTVRDAIVALMKELGS